MNPIVLRIIISLISTAAIFFALKLVSNSMPEQATIASLVVTFIIIIAALSINPTAKSRSTKRAGNSSSNSGSNSSSNNSGGASSDEETGTVKWFNVKKGYGFITRDSGDDVFVHYRNISGSGRRIITDGQRVKFVVIDGDKGLQADDVEAI